MAEKPATSFLFRSGIIPPMVDDTAIRPDASFPAAVEAASGEKIAGCYHCRKCTNGCPLAFAMDVMPNQVMRMVQLGLEEDLLGSRTIWICSGCQTCTTRCPNDIDIAHVMDTLRQLCVESDSPAAEANVLKFHTAFLNSVRSHGRVFELGMVGRYKLAAKDPFSDVKLGWEMLKRGKLKFLPHNVRSRGEIRKMFDK
jgi:heterodisulfide reductase subunit C